MKNVIVLLILCLIGWKAYTHFEQRQQQGVRVAVPDKAWSPSTSGRPTTEANNASFRCDGRTHCSQMTSCAEATFFLKSCPGVKMDGNGDGVPCEKQWCR
ncbi:excalibur calcium-binding domain-containing protein [Variovorax sp. J2P1-59]|uniref:excalibur calcium-binding domain-containing protein n=1 Tax=Variovorax flavidus TaxID=3053501 RepID=UPI002574F552|nr:excalibur calcium-binding domain-containing protein [Variovorax sp. J2P1-59]MDM0075864.1 excalibur calcium-binding domain-containing protein [Variovorax sp. J2P1-59]